MRATPLSLTVLFASASCAVGSGPRDAAPPHDARDDAPDALSPVVDAAPIDVPPAGDAPVGPDDVPASPDAPSPAMDSGPAPTGELPARATGIWYSTWYAAQSHYVWIRGHGVGSNRQFLADVDGDGRADAVVYFASGGDWYVARSNGNGFDGYVQWIHGHGIGSDNQLLGDVTGDGRADAVVYFASSGTWYVAPSSGSAFAPYSPWISGHGVGSNAQMLGDVDGDHRQDAVIYVASSGSWYAALSNGSSFPGYSRWIMGHGIGSSRQMLGDVNGDGRADAVVFFASNGDWYMAPSTGSAFAPYGPPAAGFGVGSSAQLLADTDGDHLADAVLFQPDGSWRVARGNATGFTVPAAGADWAVEHGAVGPSGHGAHADAAFAGDVFGTGRAAPVIFTAGDGSWRALDTSRFFKPNMQHTWEAWNIAFRPRVHGAYGVYDSGDASVLDEHLAAIESARIDFLLLDETNGIDVDGGYIADRATALCQRIAARRATDRAAPTYAFAIGAVQYTHDPASIEAEASEVWSRWVTASACGGESNYAHLGGRPLLAVYAERSDRARWEAWTGDKSASNRFSVRWVQGLLATSGTSGCDFPGGTNPGGPVPVSDWGLYYGWGVLHGTLANGTTMVVMPGWNNHRGCTVARSDGGFYRSMGWDSVIATAPSVAVINSYNEYAEETAVAPTDTSSVSGTTEHWSDPDLYWNLTAMYATRRKM